VAAGCDTRSDCGRMKRATERPSYFQIHNDIHTTAELLPLRNSGSKISNEALVD